MELSNGIGIGEGGFLYGKITCFLPCKASYLMLRLRNILKIHGAGILKGMGNTQLVQLIQNSLGIRTWSRTAFS